MENNDTQRHVVAICDSGALDSEHLAHVLDGFPNVAYATVGRCGLDTQQPLPAQLPDVILLDLSGGDTDNDAIDFIKRVRLASKTTHVIAVNTSEDDALLFRAIRAGATAHILQRDLGREMLQRVINELAANGMFFSPRVLKRILTLISETPETPTPVAPISLAALSNKERIVLKHLSAGKRPKEIANTEHISYETVRCHQKSLYRKLGVRSVAGLINVASRP